MMGIRTGIAAVILALALGPAPGSAAVGDVNQPDVCYLCHNEVEAQQVSPSVHTAFSAGTCSSCHNPHASKHAALLEEGSGELCIGCHEDLAPEAIGSSPHGPVLRGECDSCHDPHASDQPGQLKLPLVEQCAECHTAVPEWLARPVVHDPVASADCGTCHDPHGSGHEALLPGEIRETCMACHDANAAMTTAHGSPAIAESDCTMCHDPHSSEERGLLRSLEHEPFAAGNCATCHGDMGGRSDFRIADVRPLCERCHMATKVFADFPNHHILDEQKSCVQCHNPHASNFEGYLLRGAADLCSGCHFDEVDRDKPRADYITHESMECTECHDAHGSANDRYLKTLAVELCADCHEKAHRISHPVGPEVIDPRTELSVTCLSCHQLHGANFEQYIPLDPTRDLCLQCHRR
jgi:predicted CXXCH cytochrome family protein